MSSLFGRGAVTSRGRWLAIISASMLMQLPYWVATFAFVAAHEEQALPTTPVMFALGFVPLVFIVLAFTSRHPRAPGATLGAMGLFLLVGTPMALLNPVVGIVAGFGAGGIVALRRPGLPHDVRARVIALALGCLYLFVLLVVLQSGVFALVTGAALPFAVIGISDEVLSGRHETAERGSRAEDHS